MMKSFISAFVILFASFSFWGQSISVHADTNAIALGEQTKVKWLLTYRVDNGEVNIQLPKVKEVFSGAVELIEAQPIDTTVDKNDIAQFTLSQELVITSFEIGEQKLPELEFVYNDSTIKSYPLPIMVLDVQQGQGEELDPIKDIKEDPLDWRDWLNENWQYILLGFFVGIAVGLTILYLKKRPKPQPKPEPEIIIPPHEWALEALATLKEQKMWENGAYKDYHSKLSEILRGYIEKRFQIQALEQTSDEVLFGLRTFPISEELKERLGQTLQLGDLVKFAKETPVASENEMCFANAKLFIEQTSISNSTSANV